MDIFQFISEPPILTSLLIITIASLLILIFKIIEIRFKINTNLIVEALEALRNENLNDFNKRLDDLKARVNKKTNDNTGAESGKNINNLRDDEDYDEDITI